MHRLLNRAALAAAALPLALLFTSLCAPAGAGQETPLDRYVHAPDPHYEFHLVRKIPGAQDETFVLEMTSQAWRSPSEVDRPIWKHWLILAKPDHLRSDIGLLFISGGQNRSPAPGRADPKFEELARSTGMAVAELRMVPNQPLTFADDPVPRSEDGLIAYTWDKFMQTEDPLWLARLPMTKSAVRAMDTITAFCASPEGGAVPVRRFIVAGGSKRGWTTWTTAAADRRVVAIVPIVIDLLNLEKSFIHHYDAYGFFAPAVRDYQDRHVMERMGTPRFEHLLKIVEPYQYRDRFTMPKFLINAADDQFFLPDSSQFYFNDLPGIKYLRYVPNADHSLRRTDAFESLEAWCAAVTSGAPLPKFSFQFNEGAFEIHCQTKPDAVKLWQAHNPDARDFRLETLGPAWTSRELAADSGSGEYRAAATTPDKGWTAYFVELTFRTPGVPAPFKFTTQVHVLPDTLPFHWRPRTRQPGETASPAPQ